MDIKVGEAGGIGSVAPGLLAQLCDLAPDAICLAERRTGTSEYIFRYLNHAFEELYGCRREDCLGRDVAQFMRPRATPEDEERVRAALERGEVFRVRRGMTRPDGTFFWIEVNFKPIAWEHGVRWMFISRDVTREKQQHERMVQLTAAVEQGYDPVAVSVASGNKWAFSYVNEAFTRVTGYLAEEVLGHSWELLVDAPGDKSKIDTIRAALFAGQQVRTELNYHRKDHGVGIFELQAQPIRESSSGKYTSIVSVFRDITEARARERKLLYEAEHDLLTGLYNRRYMEHALETAIAMTRSQPAHALLFCDLDGFKEVNDRLGHETGDRVLVAAARAFESALFQTDALGRWGGDEFCVLLYHCSLPNATRTAQQMMEAFGASGEGRGTTVSLGVVRILPGDSASALVARADQLCYRAKAAGRNRVLTEGEAE